MPVFMKNVRLTVLLILLFPVLELNAQVPLLNSYPAAKAIIFLDFDGQNVSGTNWNMEGPLYCGPSNLNAAQITEIFNRVAEDYRPFNINVSTDSNAYKTAPIDRRMRVILTITSDWYGTAGGVAYTNSFTWGNNTPCFVFTALHKYNIKNIAEAASHEAGHTLGLRHQAVYDTSCRKISDYNSGTGSGIAGWAPIMGVGYYRNKTTWHYGPNPYGCANEQDDLAIITSEDNGFGYREDDNTATDFAAALKLNVDSTKLAADGLISTNTDTDLFQITMPARGLLQLQVEPYSIAPNEEGSNLDVKVELYNKNRKLINTYNPAELLSATIDTLLPSGTYYVAVSGTSNLFSSSYASLGAYTIRGAVPPAKALPSKAFPLKGAIVENSHRLNWLIDAAEPIKKQVLEFSKDGTLFLPLTNLSPDSRTYLHKTINATQYRLHITLENGQQYYSNTMALQSTTVAKPQLFTTFIHTDAVQVSSPATYNYAITNTTGQLVQKGQLQEGTSTIYMAGLKKGLYFISFENSSQRTVEKFIRQ